MPELPVRRVYVVICGRMLGSRHGRLREGLRVSPDPAGSARGWHPEAEWGYLSVIVLLGLTHAIPSA